MLIIVLLLLGLIFFLMLHSKKVSENFAKEQYTNLFTNGKCCSQKQIAQCEKYGRTGVCNYEKNDNSCMCQDGF